jgi:serine/threonine protein kinase
MLMHMQVFYDVARFSLAGYLFSQVTQSRFYMPNRADGFLFGRTSQDLSLVLGTIGGSTLWGITCLHESPRVHGYVFETKRSLSIPKPFQLTVLAPFRDIKPSNILVTDYGGVITDLSSSTKIASANSTVHGVRGTPYYWAPEQKQDVGAYFCQKSDVWSFGKVMWENFMEKPMPDEYLVALAEFQKAHPAIWPEWGIFFTNALQPVVSYRWDARTLFEVRHEPGVELRVSCWRDLPSCCTLQKCAVFDRNRHDIMNGTLNKCYAMMIHHQKVNRCHELLTTTIQSETPWAPNIDPLKLKALPVTHKHRKEGFAVALDSDIHAIEYDKCREVVERIIDSAVELGNAVQSEYKRLPHQADWHTFAAYVRHGSLPPRVCRSQTSLTFPACPVLQVCVEMASGSSDAARVIGRAFHALGAGRFTLACYAAFHAFDYMMKKSVFVPLRGTDMCAYHHRHFVNTKQV